MIYEPQVSYNVDQKVWIGEDELPYFSPDISLGEITFTEMQRHPQLIAQISATENTTLTREELFLNSQSIASYMRNIGINQSDVVAIVGRNTTHISAVVYACLFNGVTFQTLNPNHAQPTMANLFKITKPRLVFCDGDEYQKLKEASASVEDCKLVIMRKPVEGELSIHDLLATPIKPGFKPVRLEKGNNQTQVILCTSGTTGTPKAVTNTATHKFYLNTRYLLSSDVQYCHNTLDWTTGVTACISSGIHSTCRVISDEAFDPVLMLHWFEKYKITWYLGPPSHLAMMVNCPEFEKTNLDHVKQMLYGGMCASVEVQEAFRKRLKKGVLLFAYGFTELGTTNATLNRHYDEKPNSVGRILPGLKLKIVSPEGEALPPNKNGEIVIHPGQYWDGYFGNKETSREVQDLDGWIYTGDSGYVDEDGFLYISGRIKDMLKHKGLMFYPSDIEDVITQIPGVAEVCVFGIPHPVNWDEAAAVVVLRRDAKLTAEDIINYVKDNTDTEYLRLNAGCLIVSEIKRLSNGKTSREANKELFLASKK